MATKKTHFAYGHPFNHTMLVVNEYKNRFGFFIYEFGEFYPFRSNKKLRKVKYVSKTLCDGNCMKAAEILHSWLTENELDGFKSWS